MGSDLSRGRACRGQELSATAGRALASERVPQGRTLALTAEVTNTSAAALPVTAVELGLPAGLEPSVEQLAGWKKSGTIADYETAPRRVSCYWNGLPAGKRVELQLDLRAVHAGRYTAPASRIWCLAAPRQAAWAAPLVVEVTPDGPAGK